MRNKCILIQLNQARQHCMQYLNPIAQLLKQQEK